MQEQEIFLQEQEKSIQEAKKIKRRKIVEMMARSEKGISKQFNRSFVADSIVKTTYSFLIRTPNIYSDHNGCIAY